MFDLLLKNGNIVLQNRVIKGSLLIHEGKIIDILNESSIKAKQCVDVEGCYVLPGAIDTHSHFNDPGYTESEDFTTGTCAAAAGGFTAVLEMPISLPVPSNRKILSDKKAILAEKAVIDFGLWGGLITDNVQELKDMADFGAVGVKGFLTDDPYFPAISWGFIAKNIKHIADSGLLFALHCESPEVNEVFLNDLLLQGRKDAAAYPLSRPEISELLAVSSFITFARQYKRAKFYLVHSSTAESVDLAQSARQQGGQVYIETCPHYLAMDDRHIEKYGPYAVCNPPLRSKTSQEKLWQCLLDGQVDCIGSDHAPYMSEEKAIGKNDIWQTAPGMTSVQTCLPLFFDEAILKRGLSLPNFAKLTSTNAAKIFGLYPQKGSLERGTDADITIIDPNRSFTVAREQLFYKQPWSPFIGWPIHATIFATIVRGRIVCMNNEVLVGPGYGHFIKPNRN